MECISAASLRLRRCFSLQPRQLSVSRLYRARRTRRVVQSYVSEEWLH